jgi:hypothetical protein
MRAIVELRHIVEHCGEALHMLLGKLDLLYILRSGRALSTVCDALHRIAFLFFLRGDYASCKRRLDVVRLGTGWGSATSHGS